MAFQIQRRPVELAGILIVAAGSAALAGCGGSSAARSTTTVALVQPARSSTAAAQPAQKATGAGATAARIGAEASHAAGHNSRAAAPNASAATARKPGDTAQATGNAQTTQNGKRGARATAAHLTAAGPNPCALVSRSEAGAIAGEPVVSQTEAPLGPTCIYKLGGHATGDITLVVEAGSVLHLTGQIAKSQKLLVASRPAYCVRLGTQMLFVKLPGGRVLNVTASCSVAERFAAVALKRLAS